ncbi:MAG TPA: hypothetical protein VH089_05045 [Streptosporangiaceae bacterium]|nr:hypothetical protein [Streptosporangiaceae bacterium]
MTVLRLLPALCAAGAVVTLAAACGSAAPAPAASGRPAAPAISAGQLRAYVSAVEAVRLPVNRLLDQADPILDADHDHRISPAAASARMNAMEQEFAALTVEMDTIAPANPALARINAPYAHTYVLEDTYLAALASGLADNDVQGLPDTQNEQREAIIAWRTALQVAAARVGYVLPADIQQAGRGEIAPGVNGS